MSDLDLDFRPASYWDHTNPVAAILSNIKGQNRRLWVTAFVTGRAPASMGEIPSGFFEPSVDPDYRTELGSRHPSWMGGEYLPDYLPGEVEIARMVLDSVTQDVISFRARRRRNGRRILYRVVDEYMEDGRGWTCSPGSSTRPLTLQQLIVLINGARNVDLVDQHGPLPLVYREMQEGCEPKDLLNFVTVESDIYPGITEYFQQQAGFWLRQKQRASR
jgi:hypothetical protein